MTNSNASPALARLTDGGAKTYFDRKYPEFHGDGMLALRAEDGQPGSPIEVRAVAHEVNTVTVSRTVKFHLMITDSRVIFVQQQPDAPGVHLAGHVRYPWVRSIGYRPRRGLLHPAVLTIDYGEERAGGGENTWFHLLVLTLPKRIDPGPIAHEIATRLARHHLRHGAPEEAIEQLSALAVSAPVQHPARGKLGSYYSPAFVLYPGGAEYLEDDAPVITWQLA